MVLDNVLFIWTGLNSNESELSLATIPDESMFNWEGQNTNDEGPSSIIVTYFSDE